MRLSLGRVNSRALVGIDGVAVTVEVYLSGGLPAFNLVGMADTAVREARERVRAALSSCGFSFPQSRVTVSLAPADLPKDGGRFDLPIAIGILAAKGLIAEKALADIELVGELSLAGELRQVPGLVPTAMASAAAQRVLIAPALNAEAAGLAAPEHLLVAAHLNAVVAHLCQGAALSAPIPQPPAAVAHRTDLLDVKGQIQARRALEVAAAGAHNLLFVGPPGTGKTLLAERLPSILPPLSHTAAREAAALASLVGLDAAAALSGIPPFRAPHHTASAVALVGGGGNPRPGEISLAHGGVLFLDELPEYPRQVLDVLRQPLESGQIHIARAARQVVFPARFQLVAAMNPCPCGYFADPDGQCRCTADQVQRYRSRISGPLLDRIDLTLDVPRLSPLVLRRASPGESSQVVRARVEAAQARQWQRQGCRNAELRGEALEQHTALDAQAENVLAQAVERLRLSARGFDRSRRVARTLADLAGHEQICAEDIAEAISYRQPTRL